MEFPTLYGKPSSGTKVKVWTIKVDTSDDGTAFMVREHGYIDHKQTTASKHVTKGKNLGKRNETTAYEQACNEARSLWKKQIESGYSETKDGSDNVKILPMLAHDYNKRHNDISSNFCTQPKIDGVRLIATRDCGNISFFSRTGKRLKHLDHLAKDIIANNLLPQDNMYLDGELFTPDLPFEEISGLFRSVNLCEAGFAKLRLLKFHVFDVFFTRDQSNLTFGERWNMIYETINGSRTRYIVPVQTIFHKKPTEPTDVIIKRTHARHINEGYEGVIVRNCDSLYKMNYRSKDLQKYKEFTDNEYKIVGGREALGEDRGTVVFECECDSKLFNVRPRGSRALRKHMLENLDSYVNKMLTVRYQNLTEQGVPRFPVGITIRDYE